MTLKAQAMALTAPGKLEPIDLAIPDIDADSALLRIEACGICGTDCEQFATGMRLPMPHIPGHEPLGIIEKIGDLAAKKWQVDVGDRVAVETLLACHICKRCLAGDYHLCAQRQVYSTIPVSEGHGLWGAYANYMVLDGRSILHKQGEMSSESIRAHVKSQLADYKAPKNVIFVDKLQRSPNGKPDTKWANELVSTNSQVTS